MTKNMGLIDKGIRIILAFGFALLYLMDVIPGTLGIILLAAGVVLLTTVFLGTCPLYMPFGISTRSKGESV